MVGGRRRGEQWRRSSPAQWRLLPGGAEDSTGPSVISADNKAEGDPNLAAGVCLWLLGRPNNVCHSCNVTFIGCGERRLASDEQEFHYPKDACGGEIASPAFLTSKLQKIHDSILGVQLTEEKSSLNVTRASVV
ncbi:hypothetical protein PR048_027440 [Dryococelus australis]|uniref:Uncharacterized protein n=1 Tax=Dryococelus australis TaxID=614101 RepID=A0ABQ9GGE3_9NEOP|nr:hypothetical protein PR048_027440 [Dryococelus australis]